MQQVIEWMLQLPKNFSGFHAEHMILKVKPAQVALKYTDWARSALLATYHMCPHILQTAAS